MEAHSATKLLMSIRDSQNPTMAMPSELSLTAKDGLFIATECHLALFPDEDGDTALHLAVVRGDLEACKKLLELFKIAGKSIDVYNKILQTPLHVSIITNQKDIVKLLISNKADPNTPDRYGLTAYHLCAKYDYHECLLEILHSIGDRTPELNIRNYEGLTSLHMAVLNSAVSTFKLLVANGADIDAKDNKGGRTPLVYAIEMNDRSIVEMLLECDASLSQQTYSGDTALHIASGRGLQDIVRLLLRQGADATMKNTHSETAMSLATSPSVTDILRARHEISDSPDIKPMTPADSQYTSYLAKNMPVPIPPQFLNLLGNSVDEKGIKQSRVNLIDMKKRARKYKLENNGYENEEVIPAKRFANNLTIATTRVNIPIATPILFPENRIEKIFPPQVVILKQEYIEAKEKEKHAVQDLLIYQNQMYADHSMESVDENNMKREFEGAEEVEITMEEVVVSAEEVVETKSDGEENRLEINSVSSSDDQKSAADPKPQAPYKHKLMQYSTNLTNKTSTLQNNINTTAKGEMENILENKPVIVIRQPQVDMATAFYRSNFASNSAYNTFTPTPASQSQISKSKSVPNSPQPPEANLYQLAREGLAVAAMANSTNQSHYPGREFGITNYLKARPSRQAKIKSGTEELQHLALQGLAVAAMNAKSESLLGGPIIKNKKSAEEGDTPSNLATVPEILTQTLNHADQVQPPVLHRSNSMPPKHYFESRETGQDMLPSFEKTSAAHLSSNNALLALAHANARKENVGQAVSAISMGRSQIHSTPSPKYPAFVSPISSDVSENTKQNLRQAIMVKNLATTAPQKQLQKVYEIYDPNTRTFKSRLSIKIVPTTTTGKNMTKLNSIIDSKKLKTKGFATPIGKPQKVVISNEQILRSKSPILKNVADVSIQLEQRKSEPPQKKTKIVITEIPRQINNQAIKIHPSPQLIKSIKEVTPTNTVAPLQILPNTGGAPLLTRKAEQQTLISVAMAPIVASRVSSPITTTKEPTPMLSNTHTIATMPHVSFAQTNIPSLVSQSVPSIPAPATAIPQMPLGLQGGQVLNPSLANLGLMGHHTGSPYLHPQIAYAPYGKDFIPVLMQPYQNPFPQYALPVQASQIATNMINHPAQNATAGVQINPAYLTSVPRMPTIDPNLIPRMAMSVQDAQLRGLYPMASPIYGNQVQQQFGLLQQQQQQQQHYIKSALLHQHQQSLLLQNKPTIASVVLTSATPSKPFAAVTAVPVPKTTWKIDLPEAEEQPLNLSKRATEQPLNLMKNMSTSAVPNPITTVRSSVIKVASLRQNQLRTTTGESDLGTRVTQIYQQTAPVTSCGIPALGDQSTHPGVILPPPLLIPGAVPNQGHHAALSSHPFLPPIHYVNGLPFYLSLPPQL